MRTKGIAVLGYDDVQGLDIVGPLDAFAAANAAGAGLRSYETVLLGLTNGTFRSESGITFKPKGTIDRVGELDTLIIPGGRSLRSPEMSSKVAAVVERVAGRVRRMASVCTGVYGIAPTGLLDGRHVTTHWRFAADLGRRFPKLKVDANALFLKDGPFYTSAGVTAGIDLSLALIEEDLGQACSLAAARELVVYFKRPGGQEQYPEALQYQAESVEGFHELSAYIVAYLQGDLSVEKLAERMNLCPSAFLQKVQEQARNYSRRFCGTDPPR